MVFDVPESVNLSVYVVDVTVLRSFPSGRRGLPVETRDRAQKIPIDKSHAATKGPDHLAKPAGAVFVP
jgi:hypothetical protein